MSHFMVAVFSRAPADVQYLLEPYCEEVEPGSEYAAFRDDPNYDEDEITGRCGYWFNPDAQWDWYEVGGRWSGELKLLPDKVAAYEPDKRDCALVTDCDFRVDNVARQKALRFWEVTVEKQPLDEGEKPSDFESIFLPEYYITQYGNKETYAKANSMFMPYAFITADGEWNSVGNMGWFGLDDATAESRSSCLKAFEAYLKVAKSEQLYITIVDCHI